MFEIPRFGTANSTVWLKFEIGVLRVERRDYGVFRLLNLCDEDGSLHSEEGVRVSDDALHVLGCNLVAVKACHGVIGALNGRARGRGGGKLRVAERR